MKYDFSAIEKKWQEKWLRERPFGAVNGDTARPKFYGLIEFPYPSGQGLHVGHGAAQLLRRNGQKNLHQIIPLVQILCHWYTEYKLCERGVDYEFFPGTGSTV